ncbi:RMP1 [[Candida] subhashii]|uniref:RMP1 n=1 Tax=[Candida] subhashii TaxID=561895 RepID=A0A8J5QE33_9ASCO|nr:RMP1 [[Candida] subhashii]KAG7660684.1 RMP1 [[Candida] subhashii]
MPYMRTSSVEKSTKMIVKLAQGLVKRTRGAYWAYNSILCLGQFINLGFALIGGLARIYSLLVDIPGVKPIGGMNNSIEEVMKEGGKGEEEEGDDDIGEEVKYEPEVEQAIPEKRRSEDGDGESIDDIFGRPKKKKSKKSKENSKTETGSIDDIFSSSQKSTPQPIDDASSSIDSIFGDTSKKQKKKTKTKKKKKSSAIDDIFS